LHKYDGYWRDSAGKPLKEALYEAKVGAELIRPAPSMDAEAARAHGVPACQPVAWMHEFKDPHTGERRCEPRLNKPQDYELLPGDTVRPLVYAAGVRVDAPSREDVQFLIDLAAKESTSTFERRTLVRIARQLAYGVGGLDGR
jgi:hypothetical protein